MWVRQRCNAWTQGTWHHGLTLLPRVQIMIYIIVPMIVMIMATITMRVAQLINKINLLHQLTMRIKFVQLYHTLMLHFYWPGLINLTALVQQELQQQHHVLFATIQKESPQIPQQTRFHTHTTSMTNVKVNF